jgi:hypothetical protein
MVKARATAPRKRVAAKHQAPRKRQPIDGSKIKGSETSLAERKRRQPTCSIASLRNLENEETLESDFIGLFGAKSESHDTWGKTKVEPIPATKRKGKAPRLWHQENNHLSSLFGQRDIGGPKIPNSPNRSYFLKFPLEIREKIYETFLLYPESIVVKHDLTLLERANICRYPILRVCRQIRTEVTNYVYRVNIFRAILRVPRNTYHLHESFMIKPEFLSRLRNVIIECEKRNYGFDWYENASRSMEKLVRAKAILESLTFVMIPQRVGFTTTAVGDEARPITFADFLYFPGRLMRAFRQIPCKRLNIVVKKTYNFHRPETQNSTIDLTGAHSPSYVSTTVDLKLSEPISLNRTTMELAKIGQAIEFTTAPSREAVPAPHNHDDSREPDDAPETNNNTITKRFLISLDLTYLARRAIEEGHLRNAATVEIQRGKAVTVRQELIRLKKRFEDVYENDEKAVEEGKCRLMSENEKIIDIISSGGLGRI